MPRVDLQPLCDRIFSLAALDIDIADCGHRRTLTFNDARLQLQRRRVDGGESEQWAPVIKVKPSHLELIDEWVRIAQLLDAGVEWRLAGPDGDPIDSAPSADAHTSTTEKANDPAT